MKRAALDATAVLHQAFSILNGSMTNEASGTETVMERDYPVFQYPQRIDDQ